MTDTPQTPQEPNDKLDLPERTQIFVSLTGTPDLTQDDVAYQVDALTDLDLARFLRDCHNFHRTMTFPAAAELLKRYNAAHDRGELYLGFSNFDKMCPAVTGFTGTQIRNYAKGYKTPPKKVKAPAAPLDPAETEFRANAKDLQARTDATVNAALEQRAINTENDLAGKFAVEEEAAFVNPNPQKDVTVTVDPVLFRKERRLFEESLDLLCDALEVIESLADLNAEEKATRKAIVDFLHKNNINYGGRNSGKAKAAAAGADGGGEPPFHPIRMSSGMNPHKQRDPPFTGSTGRTQMTSCLTA